MIICVARGIVFRAVAHCAAVDEACTVPGPRASRSTFRGCMSIEPKATAPPNIWPAGGSRKLTPTSLNDVEWSTRH